VPRQQARHLTHRPGPADETAQRGREAMHARLTAQSRRARRPAPGQPGRGIQAPRDQLEQPHRPVQVLQLPLAHIDQGEP
jgi:hypothetical protein